MSCEANVKEPSEAPPHHLGGGIFVFKRGKIVYQYSCIQVTVKLLEKEHCYGNHGYGNQCGMQSELCNHRRMHYHNKVGVLGLRGSWKRTGACCKSPVAENKFSDAMLLKLMGDTYHASSAPARKGGVRFTEGKVVTERWSWESQLN